MLLVLAALAVSVRPLWAVTYLQEGFNYAPGDLGGNSPWVNATPLVSVTIMPIPTSARVLTLRANSSVKLNIQGPVKSFNR